MDYLLNSKALRWTLIALALCLLAVVAFRISAARAWYYTFLWEDASARICAFDTDWDDEAEDAADNYDDDTVLSLNWQDPCLTNHEIANFAADYGPSGWLGFAYTYTNDGTDPCFDWDWTGNCNNTDNRADFAYIMWNTYEHDDYEIDEPDWQARHELGHVFGRKHPTGSACNNPDDSVMIAPNADNGNCGDTYFSTLQDFDIEEIFRKYDD